MKTEQENVRALLLSTITQLCQNGLMYKKDLKVQGLLAITIDDDDIFVVQLNENVRVEVNVECPPVVSVPEMTTAVAVSKEFPGLGKSSDMLSTSRPGTGELPSRSGGQIEMSNVMNCKAKTPQFGLKSGRETFVGQNGEHNKLAECNIEFDSTPVEKDATENPSMLLPATFTIPMTVNYSTMKTFPGAECFRDTHSDQIDFVFQDFQASGSVVQGDPGRLTCQTVTANSGTGHGQPQPGFPSNIGSGQAYQHFAGMISTPQASAKLELLPGIGKRILPQTVGNSTPYITGQVQATPKKPKQESRLPRRPRESTEKRFRCPLCNLTYYYKKHLKFHMQQKHGLHQNLT